ncbi:MAG: hypothetical protein HY763_04290 [Planctomycetes bacterium]|nr:hypothetical protein [Planctomycetota bacterium]
MLTFWIGRRSTRTAPDREPRCASSALGATAAIVALLALAALPAAGTSFDFDASGYVDPADFLTLKACYRGPGQAPAAPCITDVDDDHDDDVDLADVAAFLRAAGHLPIPLKDVAGQVLTVTSTAPYSSRNTCGGCHDVDHIANGFLFQQGRTDTAGNMVMGDDHFGDGRWWIQSAGMYGTWRPKNDRQMAPKNAAGPSAMDQTAFWWMGGCGGCHTGGGGMEFDRDGQRYYDVLTGRFGYQALGKTAAEVLLDGDYATLNPVDGTAFRPAPWDVTGVAEPDCLFCHRKDRRQANGRDLIQLRRANVLVAGAALVDDQGAPVPAFAAASTAGQGWFSHLETTVVPPRLQIDYSAGVSDGSLTVGDDSTVSLSPRAIAYPPTDYSCWGCHSQSWPAKRGSVWFDDRDVHYAGFNKLRDTDPTNDVPPERSTACNYCHRGNIDHNFAKGKSQFNIYRDDLDWVNLRSCRDCHLEDSPVRHPDAPVVPGDVQVHLIGSVPGENGPFSVFSCQACHIPYALGRTRSVVDNSVTGTPVSYWAEEFLSADPVDPANPDKSRWYPGFSFKNDSDGVRRLFPLKFEIAVYWGDWHRQATPLDFSDDIVSPIVLWRVRQITSNAPLPVVTDDNHDGKPEVNRPEEILAYIQALKGMDSYGVPVAANPVLVKGRRVWFEDPGSPDGVSSFAHETSGIKVEWGEAYELHPPVLSADKALGYSPVPALGCNECHRPATLDSPVFDRMVLVDPFDPTGRAVYETVRQMTGLNPP